MPKEKTEPRYFIYPIVLNSLLNADDYKDRMNEIISYSYMNYIFKFVEESQLVKQLYYCYFHKKDALNDKLIRTIDELELCPDYKGFETDGTYNPMDEEIEPIVNLLNENSNFFEDARLYVGCHIVADYFKIEIHNPIIASKHYKKINTIIGEFMKPYNVNPKVAMVNKSRFFEVRDGNFSPEEFQLLAAVRAKVGKNRYSSTTWEELAGLMSGYQRKSMIPKDADLISKYRIKKIFEKLESKKMTLFVFVPTIDNRSIYISCQRKEPNGLIEPKDLINAIAKTKKEYKSLCDKKRDAVDEITKQLKPNIQKNNGNSDFWESIIEHEFRYN
jgi:hypothetical protein